MLNLHGMNHLRSGRTPRQPKSYSSDVPGERVQMDTVKIALGLFQFTAVDDHTRMRVLALYPRRTAQNTVRFLKEHVLEEFPSLFSASRPTGAERSSARRSSGRLLITPLSSAQSGLTT